MRFLTVAIIAFCVSANAMATDYKVGSIAINAPWSRASPKGAQTAIGYMTIKNNGTTSDRLVGGSIEVADRFDLHAMTMENDISKMRDLSGTIDFKPGASHAMFVGLKRPLSKGDRVKGTLIFEHAGTVQIEYDVQGIGAQHGPQAIDHMQH